MSTSTIKKPEARLNEIIVDPDKAKAVPVAGAWAVLVIIISNIVTPAAMTAGIIEIVIKEERDPTDSPMK